MCVNFAIGTKSLVTNRERRKYRNRVYALINVTKIFTLFIRTVVLRIENLLNSCSLFRDIYSSRELPSVYCISHAIKVYFLPSFFFFFSNSECVYVYVCGVNCIYAPQKTRFGFFFLLLRLLLATQRRCFFSLSCKIWSRTWPFIRHYSQISISLLEKWNCISSFQHLPIVFCSRRRIQWKCVYLCVGLRNASPPPPPLRICVKE